jgi:hypothetical protein
LHQEDQVQHGFPFIKTSVASLPSQPVIPPAQSAGDAASAADSDDNYLEEYEYMKGTMEGLSSTVEGEDEDPELREIEKMMFQCGRCGDYTISGEGGPCDKEVDDPNKPGFKTECMGRRKHEGPTLGWGRTMCAATNNGDWLCEEYRSPNSAKDTKCLSCTEPVSHPDALVFHYFYIWELTICPFLAVPIFCGATSTCTSPKPHVYLWRDGCSCNSSRCRGSRATSSTSSCTSPKPRVYLLKGRLFLQLQPLQGQ